MVKDTQHNRYFHILDIIALSCHFHGVKYYVISVRNIKFAMINAFPSICIIFLAHTMENCRQTQSYQIFEFVTNGQIGGNDFILHISDIDCSILQLCII